MAMSRDWMQIRSELVDFLEQEIYPREPLLQSADKTLAEAELAALVKKARAKHLWAFGHPEEIGGMGLPFLEYAYLNEVIGRSEFAQRIFGTYSLQDSIMLNAYASDSQRERYLLPLVAGDINPSFAMTEPGISSSDPTQLQTTAELIDGYWHINGRKWFTTGADIAAYTTVMCRTETQAPDHSAFSMIIVPMGTPGYSILRDTPVLGIAGGHFEAEYVNVKVPADNLLGERGAGFKIAQRRLGPGRIFHCMRWLGQAQRAYDLMCKRLLSRSAFGSGLADKQLMQQHVFNSYQDIQACRQLTLHAAKRIDAGDIARVEIGAIKVAGAGMLHRVIDRAIQVYGAEGLTDDTPLSRMYRHAREARLYDGPDEVHVQSVAKQLLRAYEKGQGWDFGQRDAEFAS
ncbi:acyl-CoA dehydrogenase family protein [Spongiibacter marinus]|uniref:acyl-CoA dehydrogenase family protein n=1 Tax=Spongiibacter marinus TaxID=354246 RepID=UPI0004278BF6|nr:acyl-CoA dehydrogenase family protein [Spongiibacter marinus]